MSSKSEQKASYSTPAQKFVPTFNCNRPYISHCMLLNTRKLSSCYFDVRRNLLHQVKISPYVEMTSKVGTNLQAGVVVFLEIVRVLQNSAF